MYATYSCNAFARVRLFKILETHRFIAPEDCLLYSDVIPGVCVRPSPDGVCDAFRWLGPGPPSVTGD